MIDPRDTDTLDNFKRQSKTAISALRRSGRPHLLTVNGQAALVIQDARAYAIEHEIADAQADRDALAGLRESIAEADRGEAIPADEVFRLLRQHNRALRTKQRASKRSVKPGAR